MHRRQGDALAGRLIGTLELERAEIAIPRGGAARSMGDQPLIQVSA